jgi:hypothetical protein
MRDTQSTGRKQGSVIATCTCKNTYQDNAYGKGNRVHNLSGKADKKRCTSCKRES